MLYSLSAASSDLPTYLYGMLPLAYLPAYLPVWSASSDLPVWSASSGCRSPTRSPTGSPPNQCPLHQPAPDYRSINSHHQRVGTRSYYHGLYKAVAWGAYTGMAHLCVCVEALCLSACLPVVGTAMRGMRSSQSRSPYRQTARHTTHTTTPQQAVKHHHHLRLIASVTGRAPFAFE